MQSELLAWTLLLTANLKLFIGSSHCHAATHTLSLTMLLQRPPLTSAVAVCQGGGSTHHEVEALSHVLSHISAFLTSKHWTLLRACEGNYFSLLCRLAAHEPRDMDPHYKAFQFSKGLVLAVVNDNLEMVAWLCSVYCPTGFASKGVEKAAELGNLRILQWLAEHHDEHIFWTEVYMDIAAENGHLEVLKWLHTHPKNGGCTKRAICHAARNGHFEVVEWLHDHFDERPQETLRYAILGGHVGIAKFLYRHNYELEASNGIDDAAWSGELEMVKWVHELGDTECTRDAMDFAVGSGHLSLLQWLQENRTEDCSADAMDKAAGNGHLEIVQWLHENQPTARSNGAICAAAKNGHFDIVQWLHESRYGHNDSVIEAAASSGDLDMVMWLDENRPEPPSWFAMAKAAETGHLHIMKWLHENSEGDFEDALDGAATNGQLAAVRWLHENRHEGCTTKAMDGAARNNHLHVVKWLHENRTEGCTTEAMDRAGSCEVMRWLHENRTEGCTTKAMDNAVARGDLETVMFLHANRSEGCSDTVSNSVGYGGYLELFMWLCEHRRDNIDVDMIRSKFDTPQYKFVDMHWLEVGWVTDTMSTFRDRSYLIALLDKVGV